MAKEKVDKQSSPVRLLMRKCDNAAIDERRQDGKNEDNPRNQDLVSHPAHIPDYLSDIGANHRVCNELSNIIHWRGADEEMMRL